MPNHTNHQVHADMAGGRTQRLEAGKEIVEVFGRVMGSVLDGELDSALGGFARNMWDNVLGTFSLN